MTTPQKIQTLVFFDLESTGLTAARITEVSMVAVHRDQFVNYSRDLNNTLDAGNTDSSMPELVPRVMNKLTLAVNPMKLVDPVVESLTGLSNYNLEHQSKFKAGAGPAIAAFLESLAPPVCLVAHNGDRFDFPLLNKELSLAGLTDSCPDLLLACDSLKFFRQHFSKDKKYVKDSDEDEIRGGNKRSQVKKVDETASLTKIDVLERTLPSDDLGECCEEVSKPGMKPYAGEVNGIVPLDPAQKERNFAVKDEEILEIEVPKTPTKHLDSSPFLNTPSKTPAKATPEKTEDCPKSSNVVDTSETFDDGDCLDADELLAAFETEIDDFDEELTESDIRAVDEFEKSVLVKATKEDVSGDGDVRNTNIVSFQSENCIDVRSVQDAIRSKNKIMEESLSNVEQSAVTPPTSSRKFKFSFKRKAKLEYEDEEEVGGNTPFCTPPTTPPKPKVASKQLPKNGITECHTTVKPRPKPTGCQQLSDSGCGEGVGKCAPPRRRNSGKPPSFKLGAVYEHSVGRGAPVQSHGAEVDSVVLLQALAATSSHDFLTWADRQARLLSEFPAKKST